MSTPGGTPAGWYDDGTGTGTQRYWDGARWTEHTQPAAGVQSPHGQGFASSGAQGAAPYGGYGDFSYGPGGQPVSAAPAPGSPYGGYGSPYGQPGATQGPTKVHPLGWTALALAVVGLVFACVPVALVVGWILLPVAFVLAIVTFFVQGKKWPVITALIFSVVGMVVAVFVVPLFLVNADDEASGDANDTVTSAPEDEGTATEVDPTDEDPAEEDPVEDEPASGDQGGALTLGTTVTGDEYDVTINTFDPDATDAVLAANTFNEEPRDGYVYAVANVSVTYTGQDSGMAVMTGIDYVTGDGETVRWSDNLAVPPAPQLGIEELADGDTATGNLVFEIPEGDDGVLSVRPGLLDDEVTVATK